MAEAYGYSSKVLAMNSRAFARFYARAAFLKIDVPRLEFVAQAVAPDVFLAIAVCDTQVF